MSAFSGDDDKTPDAKDLNGNSPLHIALAAGHEQSVTILLDHQLNEGEYRQNDIAHNIGATSPLELEKASRIDMSDRNDEGETILGVAVATQVQIVMKRLFGLRANIHCPDQSNLFLQYAIGNSDMAFLAELIGEKLDLFGAVYTAVEANASDEIVVELLKVGFHGAGFADGVPDN